MISSKPEVTDVGAKEITLYEKEISDSIDMLKAKSRSFQEANWFIDQLNAHFDIENMRAQAPKLIALGGGVPDELMYAASPHPLWVLGGSLATAHWADALVPRDTDPIHRSIMGFLENPEFDLARDALIVIPAATDSQRKLAYLLRSLGKSVATIDVFPDKRQDGAWGQYLDQISGAAELMGKHTGRRVGRGNLRSAFLSVQNARRQMRTFLRKADGVENLLPTSVRMAVQFSYYCTDNLPIWTMHLNRLSCEIGRFVERRRASYDRKPRILLMGSSVCFPNYKIPFLVEDIGLTIGAVVDPLTQKDGIPSVQFLRAPTKRALLKQIAYSNYESDCSGAYVSNGTLFSAVRELISRQTVEGVVYHVLKGQIEYDFELARFERLFEQSGIPVFRLETDYQYQDVEQLRIRMEAFREMLEQNRYAGRRAAQ